MSRARVTGGNAGEANEEVGPADGPIAGPSDTTPPPSGTPPLELEEDDEEVPERIDTKVVPAKPKRAPAGHRYAIAKAVLRRGAGDVQPGTELLLSEEEFLHFAATDCVEESKATPKKK